MLKAEYVELFNKVTKKNGKNVYNGLNSHRSIINDAFRKMIKKYGVLSNELDFKDDIKNNSLTGKFLKKYADENDIPIKLLSVPYADNKNGLNIITKVSRVNVKEIEYPYNGSILARYNGDGSWNGEFDLYFRYDIIHKTGVPVIYDTAIGHIRLNSNFEQITPFKKVNTHSAKSEDPDVLHLMGKNFLTFNDTVNSNPLFRVMHIAEIDEGAGGNEIKLKYKTPMDLHFQIMEKNWIPFIYNEVVVRDEIGNSGSGEGGDRKEGGGEEGGGGERNGVRGLKVLKNEERLYFQYHMNPHKIMWLRDSREGELVHFHSKVPLVSNFPWEWGSLRGGTPGVLLSSGEYLAFFHSSFVENEGSKNDRVFWYIMGAYTFEGKQPFKITKISRWPITFRNAYDSKPNPAWKKKNVLFPTGIVLSRDQKTVWVSCGENDSSLKILTINVDNLLRSMVANRFY